MLAEYKLQTEDEGFYDVTANAQKTVCESRVESGLCVVYSPHTTAGITINENADPNVVRDLLYALKVTYPDRPQFRHLEGNTAAHLKASVLGSSVSVPIVDGALMLGTWQGIYFCEFDGPRRRKYFVKVLQG